jgi:hypothetical protein
MAPRENGPGFESGHERQHEKNGKNQQNNLAAVLFAGSTFCHGNTSFCGDAH